MKTITRRLLLVVLLAWLVISPLWAVNPPGGTCTSQCDECGSCGSDGTGTGKTQSPGLGSFDWLIQVGLARYPKPTGFTDMANAANEKDGNLPDFRQIFSRYFPRCKDRKSRCGFPKPGFPQTRSIPPAFISSRRRSSRL